MFLQALLMPVAVGAGGPPGQIAYVSGTEQEDQTVCIVDVATGVIRRVGNGRRDGAPVWSPDGRRLAFESEQDGGKRSIFVVEADGTGLRPLAHARDWNTAPRWSPDGARLAYSAGDLAERRITVYDLETGAETAWGGDKVPLLRPVWIGNDTLVAVGFVSRQAAAAGAAGDAPEASTEVFYVGRSQATLFPTTQKRYVEWAVEPDPRGKSVAYESNDGGDREIFVASLEMGVRDVSNHREADWNPVWSPDGDWVAFESFRGGRRGVYRVFPKTQRVFAVAASDAYDNWAPAWSSDGQWLAFVSDRNGQPDLYIAPVDDGEAIRLTDHAGPDLAPAWRPEGRKK